jgi:hypothetical protein
MFLWQFIFPVMSAQVGGEMESQIVSCDWARAFRVWRTRLVASRLEMWVIRVSMKHSGVVLREIGQVGMYGHVSLFKIKYFN